MKPTTIRELLRDVETMIAECGIQEAARHYRDRMVSMAAQQRENGPGNKYTQRLNELLAEMSAPDGSPLWPYWRKGRPRLCDGGAVQQPVSLTPDHVAVAKRLGDGNISKGVRVALDAIEEKS